ncbi:MAG: hypothetical protein ACXABY_37310, partial [Candidatus Thorarchaeota archaeon]
MRLNSRPNIVKGLAKKMTKFGWNEDEFIESAEALNRTGFMNVGREVATRDDLLDPKIFATKFGQFLDAGTMFFNTGERYVRISGWNASYILWRKANPLAKLNDKAVAEILNRADQMTVNMSRASNATWQKGLLGVPTQFWAYQTRLAEQFLGKRLTPAEKLRGLTTYSLIYGIPIASAVPVAVWPVGESIRTALLDRGIEYDDTVVGKVLVDGIVSNAIEWSTGTKWNFGERYGPNGLNFLQDLLSGDKTVLESFSGVSGTTIGDFIKNAEPFTWALTSIFSGSEETYPLLQEDFINFASSVSTLSQIRKTYVALGLGKYITKNEQFIDNVSGWEGLIMGLTGMQTQDTSDSFLKLADMRALTAHKREMKKDIIRYLRIGFRADTPDEQVRAFKAAKIRAEAGL